MRHVTVDAMIPSAAVESVFNAVLRWELPDPEDGLSWEWEAGSSAEPTAITSGVRPRWLDFRSGLLRWNEDIRSFRDELEIRFAQTDGDFASFSGKWVLRQHGNDVSLHFESDFDFGIPSMEGILDPIAEEAIKDTIGRAVTGMFPHLRFLDRTGLPAGPSPSDDSCVPR